MPAPSKAIAWMSAAWEWVLVGFVSATAYEQLWSHHVEENSIAEGSSLH